MEDKFLNNKYLVCLEYQLDLFYKNYLDAEASGDKQIQRRWQAMGQAVKSRIEDIKRISKSD